MHILKKVLKGILITILSILALLVIAFFILKINNKPDIIELERKPMTEAQVDQWARELVDQMMSEHLSRDGLVLLVAHQAHGVAAGVTRRLELG